MKTAAPGYTRRWPPNGHCRSHTQKNDPPSYPVAVGQWPLATCHPEGTFARHCMAHVHRNPDE